MGLKNIIFLETFNNMYRTAYEFLIAIVQTNFYSKKADPVNRPTLIHEYVITKYSSIYFSECYTLLYSLYTAMVLKYDP